MSSVGSKSLGNDEKSIGKGLDTVLGLALNRLEIVVALEVHSASNLESTSAGNHGLIDNGVVHTSQSIANGICDLSNGVLVGSLNEKSNGLRVLDLLDEGILLLAESLFVDKTGVTQNIGSHILNTVLSNTAADELQALHVAALGTAQSQDTVLSQHIQRKGIDALLVDNDKVLLAIIATNLLFEFNNLLELGINEATLTLDELISLVGARVEEARVDFSLLVLQADVHGQDVAVLEALRHIGMASTMVESKTLDELGISSKAVLHLHDFHHVQIGLGRCLVNSQNGVDNIGSELRSERSVELCRQGRLGDVEEKLAVHVLGELESVEELNYC